MKKLLPLLLLLCGASYAQTTYNLSAQTTGTWTTPVRIFNVPMNPASIAWLEVGQNTACPGESTLIGVGFIFVTLPGVNLPCAPLTGNPGASYGEFAGVDQNGIPFSGSYSLNISLKRCGYRYTKTCYTVSGGFLTITY